MNKPKLQPQGFYGTVLFKEWFKWIDDKQYHGVFGKIFVSVDKEAVGFTTRGNNANWFIEIQGKKTSMSMLGCQIRGIIKHTIPPNIDSSYKVIP